MSVPRPRVSRRAPSVETRGPGTHFAPHGSGLISHCGRSRITVQRRYQVHDRGTGPRSPLHSTRSLFGTASRATSRPEREHSHRLSHGQVLSSRNPRCIVERDERVARRARVRLSADFSPEVTHRVERLVPRVEALQRSPPFEKLARNILLPVMRARGAPR